MNKFNDVIVKKIEPVYTDERGQIKDILNENLKHVGIISTEKDAIRGNHYHETSKQYTYLLSGKIKILLAKVDSPTKIEKIILSPGELVTIPPLTIHKFKALEKSVFIEMDSKTRAGSGYEDDLIRVSIHE